MSSDLERRISELEMRFGHLATQTADAIKLVGEASTLATTGGVAALSHVVEELIADEVIDRNRLIIVLERHAEHAEEAKQNPMYRLALDGLLMMLRQRGEPAGSTARPAR